MEELADKYMEGRLLAGFLHIMRLREEVSEAVHALRDPELEGLIQQRIGLHLSAFSTLGHLGDQRGMSREAVRSQLDYAFTQIGEWLEKQTSEGSNRNER